MAAHSAPHLSWYITLRSACILTYKSRCIGNAKGAAYSALLAFFPVLTTLAVLLVRFRAQAVSQVLSRTLEQIVPPGSESLVLSRFAVTGQRPVAVLVVAVIVAIYAASGIMLSLIEGFDDIYKLPNRSFLHQRGIAALLVVLSVLPVITASTLILMGDRTERSVIASMGALKPGVLLLGRLIRIVIEIAATVGGAAILYRLAPNRATSWREVWAGAFLVTALWYITTYGFRFYVANIARYNVMYGSVAAVIALGVWLYLLAFLALYGCAVNAVRAGATRVYSPELIDL